MAILLTVLLAVFAGRKKQPARTRCYHTARRTGCPATDRNGGAENRTRVQRPTPEEPTCLAASPLPVSLRRVRRRRVSEASKTPPPSSPDFSRPPHLSTCGGPAQLSHTSLRALERLAARCSLES